MIIENSSHSNHLAQTLDGPRRSDIWRLVGTLIRFRAKRDDDSLTGRVAKLSGRLTDMALVTGLEAALPGLAVHVTDLAVELAEPGMELMVPAHTEAGAVGILDGVGPFDVVACKAKNDE